jgi:tungstate transport system ATP-binding protein
MKDEMILKAEKILLERGGATVLDIPLLTVRRGSILALIGPNGAGKSTLLLMLAGLLKPQKGRIYFQQNPIETLADYQALRRQVSVVFQEPLLLNGSVFENVALGLKFRGCGRGAVKQRVRQALDYFGIRHLEKRSAKALSGGEAKRVSLARAFAILPEVILLDEAFNVLDPPSREGIIQDLQKTLEETKTTAILALHDREETLRLAQDVCVLHNGKILQAGPTAEIFHQPASEFVAQFVGTETILPGVIQSSVNGNVIVIVDGKRIEAVGEGAVGQKVYCCLRPENITISRSTTAITSARNSFAARVIDIIRQGYVNKLVLDCGFPLVAYITLSSCEDLGIARNAVVVASFKATAVHLLRRME